MGGHKYLTKDVFRTLIGSDEIENCNCADCADSLMRNALTKYKEHTDCSKTILQKSPRRISKCH